MKLNINGEQRILDDPRREMSLLWVLRDLLGHQDVKFGCGEGHCRCCASGFRASIAASLLDRAGRDVILIDDHYSHAVELGLATS